jgi:hypothetical protein
MFSFEDHLSKNQADSASSGHLFKTPVASKSSGILGLGWSTLLGYSFLCFIISFASSFK